MKSLTSARQVILVILMLQTTTRMFSQDIIYTKDGKQFKVEVIEYDGSSIKYRPYNEPQSPVRTFDVRFVDFIKYEDGTIKRIEISTNISDPLTTSPRAETIENLSKKYERNLEAAGYTDIVLVQGDGGLGCPALSPYDKVAITAACVDVPPPLIEQLTMGGRLIAPVLKDGGQHLVLFEKGAEGVERQVICEVLYVSLRGAYGS